MTKARVHKVYHTPGFDTITIVFMVSDGPFRGQLLDRYAQQSDIALEAGNDAWGGGDEQLMAIARKILAIDGMQLDETLEVRVDKAPLFPLTTATEEVISDGTTGPAR